MSMNKTVRSDKQSVRGVENLPKKGKKMGSFLICTGNSYNDNNYSTNKQYILITTCCYL